MGQARPVPLNANRRWTLLYVEPLAPSPQEIDWVPVPEVPLIGYRIRVDR